MELDLKNTLRSSCRALLRPIASVVLRCGMTWREFSELSKSVFVSVASDEFGIRGRPTNVSRVSILTGISRKEIKKQRDLLAEPTVAISPKTTDATRLLSGWHQDPEYLDSEGLPLALSANGANPSFRSLFESYGGDTPEQTLLKELLKAGSIAKDTDGRFVAKRRYHVPVKMDAGSIRFFGTNLFDHGNTLRNNVSGEAEQRRLNVSRSMIEYTPTPLKITAGFSMRAVNNFSKRSMSGCLSTVSIPTNQEPLLSGWA